MPWFIASSSKMLIVSTEHEFNPKGKNCETRGLRFTAAEMALELSLRVSKRDGVGVI